MIILLFTECPFQIFTQMFPKLPAADFSYAREGQVYVYTFADDSCFGRLLKLLQNGKLLIMRTLRSIDPD